MNKNRIEGRRGTTSWHNTAKSSGLPVEVNAVVVQGSIVPLPGEIWRERSGQKSAEAIVVGETSRGRDARLNDDTGSLTQRRAEPNGSVLTADQTPQPTTPDGEAWTRAGLMGSMWMLRTGFGPLLMRACPASDRNRRVRTRARGGVGPVAGSQSQSRGPDCASLFPGDAVRVIREGPFSWVKEGAVVSSNPKGDLVKIADMVNGKPMFIRFRNNVTTLGGGKLTLTKL